MTQGVLAVVVWPPYVGLGSGVNGIATEPNGPDYVRGQIFWRTLKDGNILGRAECAAPKGVYSHLIFFNGPQSDAVVMGVRPLEHAIVFDRAGVVEIDPIANGDYLPRLNL